MHDDFLAALRASPSPAFARTLRARLRTLEERSRPSFRFAAAAILVVLLLSASLAIPAVRGTFLSFLDLFHGRTVADVQFDPARVEPLRAELDGKSPLRLLVGLDSGNARPVTLYPTPEAAETAMGLSLHLPGWLPEGMSLSGVRSDGAARQRLAVDRDRMHDVFDRLDLTTVGVPRHLAEGSFELAVPAQVTLEYRGPHGVVRLVQGDRPAMTMDRAFDVALCGEIGLRVQGADPEEAHRLAQAIDWPGTLVVPVPSGATEIREITVRGEPGLLIAAGAERTLLWSEGGHLLALNGTAAEETLLRVALELR